MKNADESSSDFMRPMREISIPPKTMEHNHHAALIREFITCVKSGNDPQTRAADNIKSLAMVLGAVESVATGQIVAICD